MISIELDKKTVLDIHDALEFIESIRMKAYRDGFGNDFEDVFGFCDVLKKKLEPIVLAFDEEWVSLRRLEKQQKLYNLKFGK